MDASNAKIPFANKYPQFTQENTPVVSCMEAAGYVRDYGASSCRVVAIPRRSPYCYRPAGFFPALGYRIEMFGDWGRSRPGLTSTIPNYTFKAKRPRRPEPFASMGRQLVRQ